MDAITSSCTCGAAGTRILRAPCLRVRCHCTKCQSVYKEPYADMLMFRRGQVRAIDPGAIDWFKTMRPSPLSRGRCKSCGDPVLAYLYGVLTIIPTRTAPGVKTGDVACDIYYGTRVQETAPGVPKHAGLVSTYLGLAVPLCRVLLLPGKPAEPQVS